MSLTEFNQEEYDRNRYEEGREAGISEGNAGLIQKFIKNGNMTIEQIAEIIKLPVEKVRQLAEMNLKIPFNA